MGENMGGFQVIVDLLQLKVIARTFFHSKFANDKVFRDNPRIMCIQDGVVLNLRELLGRYKVDDLGELIELLYRKNGKEFYKVFRGSFAGFFYDKIENVIITYTNHIGDRPVFYYVDDKYLLVTTRLDYMSRLCKQYKIAIKPNVVGIYSMLTYGFLIEGLTYIEGVTRLMGGQYLECSLREKKCVVSRYHNIENIAPLNHYNINDVVNCIDMLFTKSVQLQLNKNAEYHYDDFTALSAGLDSRMTTFAIDRLKQDKSYTTFTYSPIGYYDQITSMQIVRFLQNQKHIYMCDEGGALMMNIDTAIKQNEGLYMHFGSALLYDFFNTLNCENIGLIHSGQIGDAIIGTFAKQQNEINITIDKVDISSRKLVHKFLSMFDFGKIPYSNREYFSMYNRALIGVNSGSTLVFQRFTETFSPFCDVDFWEFCMSLSIKDRIGHTIYDNWVMEKYPDATRFLHNGYRRIGHPIYNHIMAFKNKAENKLLKLLNLKEHFVRSVTPLNKWLENPIVKKSYDVYFEENISFLEFNKELFEDCKQLYIKGNALEKNMVITVLGAIKLLFHEHE